GHEASTTLGPDGKPKGPIVRVETNDDGKKSYVVYGPHELIQTIAEGITRKRPDVKWTQSNYDVAVEILADGPSLEDPILRRLAAKVAFERFAQLRSAAIAAAWEFDAIRNFILTGVEIQPCCGITADPRLLQKSFNLPV